MTYSYTNQTSTQRTGIVRPTSKQLDFYSDLVTRKGVVAKSVAHMTFDEMNAEIAELRAMPDRASERQIQVIRDLHTEILSVGGEIKPIPDAFLNQLTGGREGTASRTIEILRKRLQEARYTAPPSEAQLQILVPWFLCPDIPFESLSFTHEEETVEVQIERKHYLEPLLAYHSDDHEAFEARKWRLKTPDEFAAELKRTLTGRQATSLIDQYRGAFYDWRNTRITKAQVEHIRRLEARMSDMSVTRAYDVSVSADGELIERPISTARPYTQSGYTPLTEESLLQMSNEDASRFIDQMMSELNRPQLKTIGAIDDELQQLFTEKHSGYNERTRTGNARDMVTAQAQEFNALSDYIFGLEAMCGYRADELHDALKANLLELPPTHPDVIAFTERLREMMIHAIDLNREFDVILKDTGRLLNMAEGSPFATEIATRTTRDIVAGYFA